MRRRPWPALIALVLLAACATTARSLRIAPPSRLALVYRGSSGQLLLTTKRGRGTQTLGSGAQALLAPDGSLLASIAYERRGGATLLTVVRTGGAHRSTIAARFPPSRFARAGIQLLGWSPDSRMLAITASALSASGEQPELFVLDLANRRLRAIAAGNIFGASFAPTLPDRLVYARATIDQLDSDRADLFVANADGTRTRRITSRGLAVDPTWSRQGIVFAALTRLGSETSPPRYGLWSVAANGGGLRPLAAFAAGPPAPNPAGAAISVSASGRRLVADFASPSGPGIEVWTVTLTRRGSDVRRLDVEGAVAAGISRDGTRILVTRGGSVASLSWSAASLEAHARSRSAGGGPAGEQVLAIDGSDPSWNE